MAKRLCNGLKLLSILQKVVLAASTTIGRQKRGKLFRIKMVKHFFRAESRLVNDGGLLVFLKGETHVKCVRVQ